MFKKETSKDQTGETASLKTTKARRTSEETENLIEGFGNYMGSMDKRDGYISAPLVSLIPSVKNGRIGQAQLLEALPVIVGLIQSLVAEGKTSIPPVIELADSPDFPKLQQSALMLLGSCIDLANSFIENGGYADTPPKVYPAVDGKHAMKIGHRRYIAYCLAQPITGVTTIDVIIDKGSNTQSDDFGQAVGRIAENSAREDNSVAELIYSFKEVYDLSLSRTGQRPNITHLARATNIERTQLSRIIDMVENGAGDDIELLNKIHESKIEDIVSLNLLFQQPTEQWNEAFNQLVALGASEFREKYRSLKDNGGVGESVKTDPVKDSKPKKEKPLIGKKYAPSLEKIIGLVEEHKSEWFEGIDPSATADEKLKWVLEKLSNEKA